jgi:hypothetical protein
MTRHIHRVVSASGAVNTGFRAEAPGAAVAESSTAARSGDDGSRENSTTRPGDRQTSWLRITVLAMLACALLSLVQAHAEAQAAVCARLGDDDTARQIPASLVPAVNALFGTKMSSGQTVASAVFRCAGGRVLVCTTGANLPCGPANTSRVPGPGAVAWCRDHSGAAFIPAFASRHDSIFAWECRNGAPRIARQVHAIDARGFIAEYWKELPE